MSNRLFLLDGMALAYRAHFAFLSRPIMTAKGVNTSALFGFASHLLDILKQQQPTHLAVAFDTQAPTARHVEFKEYKAQREEMPEDLAFALPNIKRLCAAMNIPVLERDGFEADDIIGTLVRRAERESYESWMVTPDKDFAQLVDEHTFILKPGKGGSDIEIIKLPEVRAKWGVERPEQVIDILGLWGDASDNIPGVPGIGEKTAAKLIAQFGSIEQLLARTGELKGKQKENLEAHREQALLSKRLATINCEVPLSLPLSELKVHEPDAAALKSLFVEFEFNSLGRRMFGEDYKAGRGFEEGRTGIPPVALGQSESGGSGAEGVQATQLSEAAVSSPAKATLKTIADVPHNYSVVRTPVERRQLAAKLAASNSFCFDTETTGLDPQTAVVIGIAFSWAAHQGAYVQLTSLQLREQDLFAQDNESAMRREAVNALEDFRAVLADERIAKTGHNLKFDLGILRWHGLEVRGVLFDTMLAHSLIEPDQRHGMDYLSEVYLGYTPVPITALIGEKKTENMANVPLDQLAEYAAEDADVTWQLRAKLEPLLKERGLEKVFYEIESPLLPVIMDMEAEGIRIDSAALAEFSRQLEKQMALLEARIHQLAGEPFNLNSPKQLGTVLYEKLKLVENPKKTRTGQYSTDEDVLQLLAAEHEIVRLLLEYRSMSKLKSTYADALPQAISPRTGRVHTTFQQAATATGRLASNNPNLQNIPIRTELGQEIRRAFVPRDENHLLLSADYSQIELRIIAAISRDEAMLAAFASGEDIHTATAARVFGVALKDVDSEQRRKAKMVNFGIAYGISAFGLAQRLGIPRGEAAQIIEHYFASYPGIRRYIDDTIAGAKKAGYVETVTGRRRFLRDINSANGTTRAQAERFAINTPIQGTAADMIKLAMSAIHRELAARKLKTKLLLQVHDELVFDVPKAEEAEVRVLVEDRMKHALPLAVPLEVELGTGATWLAAH